MALNPEVIRALQMMSQSALQPPTPPPTPGLDPVVFPEAPEFAEPEKIGGLSQAGLTIANALNAFARGINPNVVPQDFLGREVRRREGRADVANRRNEFRFRSETASATRQQSQRNRQQDIERRSTERDEDIERSDTQRQEDIVREMETERGRTGDALLDAAAGAGVQVPPDVAAAVRAGEGQARTAVRNAVARAIETQRQAEMSGMSDRERADIQSNLENANAVLDAFISGDPSLNIPSLDEHVAASMQSGIDKQAAFDRLWRRVVRTSSPRKENEAILRADLAAEFEEAWSRLDQTQPSRGMFGQGPPATAASVIGGGEGGRAGVLADLPFVIGQRRTLP